MQMALILSLHRGDVDHLPDLTLALLIADQHAEQLAHVEPITLGPTLAPIDFNRGGIHHMIGDVLCQQEPMQPKPFSTGFVATDQGGRFRQPKAAFGLGDFVEHAILTARRHIALARLLPRPGGEAELPRFVTQFKTHKQSGLSWVILLLVGRFGRHGLTPPL